jgi:hypothetical protein
MNSGVSAMGCGAKPDSRDKNQSIFNDLERDRTQSRIPPSDRSEGMLLPATLYKTGG